MRFASPAFGFCALSALAWGCTVYDTGLLPSNSELTDGGSGTTSSGSSSGGSASNVAGSFSSSGKSASTGGMIGDAGDTSLPTAGTGATTGAGGDGGDGSVSGGTGGGASGSGGKGGSGGGAAGSGGKGGSGGSGGSPPVAKCADHSIPSKTTWVATASSESLGNGMESDGLYNPAIHMTDGSYSERWSSGKTQSGDEWIQIDFGAVVNLTTFTLNVNNDTGDYPRAYAVRLTATPDPMFKASPIASGAGAPGNTVILFPMATGRYLTVRQTGVNTENTAWWTIAEVLAGCTDK